MPDMARQRGRMIDRQLVRRGIRDARVLDAMRNVPREHFVSEELRPRAYEDGPLPIGGEQTISQPFIVALMAEAAEIAPTDRVLEIGTGSGYAAAVLAMLAGRVFTIERHRGLAESARDRLAELDLANVEVRVGDGTRGCPDAGPFDAILAAAGGPVIPDSLKDQLALGGRLIMPVGPSAHAQQLVKLTRTGPAQFMRVDLGGVRFVPLVGAFGWAEPGEPPC